MIKKTIIKDQIGTALPLRHALKFINDNCRFPLFSFDKLSHIRNTIKDRMKMDN